MLSITATTNLAARAHLVYGTSADKLIVQTDPTASSTTHTMSVGEGLTPGSNIFYKVVATDGQSTQESAVRSITLKGMSVKIALLDKFAKAISNQKVTLVPSDVTAKSDGSGSVIFDNLIPGDYTLQISDGSKTHQQHITVLSTVVTNDGAQTAEQQLRAVIFDDYVAAAFQFPAWSWYVGGAVLALGVMSGLGYLSWRRGGLVRGVYLRAKYYRLNKKLGGAVAGDFVPVVGSAATPGAPIGSAVPSHSAVPAQQASFGVEPPQSQPSIDSSPATERMSSGTAYGNNPFNNDQGRHDG